MTETQSALLQRAHGVAGERDREQQQHRRAGGQHRLHREPPAELEHRVADRDERDRGGADAERDLEPEARREDRERLVEEHGLEALAVDGREAEPGERDGAAGRDRRRDRARA